MLHIIFYVKKKNQVHVNLFLKINIGEKQQKNFNKKECNMTLFKINNQLYSIIIKK